MPETPNLQELSRRLLDLWQQQLSAWATDPELARSMAAWLEAWTKAGDAVAPWAKAPGLAPGGGNLDLERIESRLAAVERRLAELDRGARSKPRRAAAKRPAGKARRRRRS
jgi:hypothetical protein